MQKSPEEEGEEEEEEEDDDDDDEEKEDTMFTPTVKLIRVTSQKYPNKENLKTTLQFLCLTRFAIKSSPFPQVVQRLPDDALLRSV